MILISLQKSNFLEKENVIVVVINRKNHDHLVVVEENHTEEYTIEKDVLHSVLCDQGQTIEDLKKDKHQVLNQRLAH